MVAQIMACFGHAGDNVFDFFFEAELRAHGEIERIVFISGAMTFSATIARTSHAAIPSLVRSWTATPATGGRAGEGRQAGGEADSTFNLSHDFLLIVGGLFGLFHRHGFQQRSAMRWTARERQMAEGGPDFVPDHLAIGSVF